LDGVHIDATWQKDGSIIAEAVMQPYATIAVTACLLVSLQQLIRHSPFTRLYILASFWFYALHFAADMEVFDLCTHSFSC